MIEVLRAGPLTTIQDLGRPGFAHLGVPRSGALDGPALCLGNRLVGNAEDAAGLEITAAGCVLRLHVAAPIAVTGAAADITVDGRPAPYGVALAVRPQSTVAIGPARHGVRSYLAVGGGIVVAPTLGSRSTDTLSGLGPPPLRDGDRLPIGAPPAGDSIVDFTPWEPAPRVHALRIRPGPRVDWFAAGAMAQLCGTAYTLSPVSNRIGARLSGGDPLIRSREGELPSEGVVCGAVQVPADGRPLVFLADHPTTGGYPVIAVVEAADLTGLAQARPGDTVTFRGSER